MEALRDFAPRVVRAGTKKRQESLGKADVQKGWDETPQRVAFIPT